MRTNTVNSQMKLGFTSTLHWLILVFCITLLVITMQQQAHAAMGKDRATTKDEPIAPPPAEKTPTKINHATKPNDSDSIDRENQGYLLLSDTCPIISKLTKRYPKKTWAELQRYLSNNQKRALSRQALQLTSDAKEVISLFKAAAEAKLWLPEGIHNHSLLSIKASTPSCYIDLRLLYSLHLLSLIQESKFEEAFDALLSANKIEIELIKSGSLQDFFTQIKARRQDRPLLNALIPVIHSSDRYLRLKQLLQHYSQIPSLAVLMETEQMFAKNTLRAVYRQYFFGQRYTAYQRKLISRLTANNAREKLILAVANGQLFSPKQWQQQAEEGLDLFYGGYALQLSSSTTPELEDLNLRIISQLTLGGSNRRERDQHILKGITQGQTLNTEDAWRLWTKHLDTQLSTPNKNFSPKKTYEIFRALSNTLSYNLVEQFAPPIDKIGFAYRQHIAAERISIIELAQRIFRAKDAKALQNLKAIVKAGLVPPLTIQNPHTLLPFIARKNSDGLWEVDINFTSEKSR